MVLNATCRSMGLVWGTFSSRNMFFINDNNLSQILPKWESVDKKSCIYMGKASFALIGTIETIFPSRVESLERINRDDFSSSFLRVCFEWWTKIGIGIDALLHRRIKRVSWVSNKNRKVSVIKHRVRLKNIVGFLLGHLICVKGMHF